jgi:hypothetical protein
MTLADVIDAQRVTTSWGIVAFGEAVVRLITVTGGGA